MSFWDFLYNTRVIHLFSLVRLSWDSLRYIVVRFFENSFVILMQSHGCLRCDSSGETIMRFLKKSFAVLMISHGIILLIFIFPFKLHWIHVSIICTTLVEWNCSKCSKQKLHTYWFCFAESCGLPLRTDPPFIYTKVLSCAHIRTSTAVCSRIEHLKKFRSPSSWKDIQKGTLMNDQTKIKETNILRDTCIWPYISLL